MPQGRSLRLWQAGFPALALLGFFTSSRLCGFLIILIPPGLSAHSESNGCQVLHSLGPIG
jgi:hypothetical protein